MKKIDRRTLKKEDNQSMDDFYKVLRTHRGSVEDFCDEVGVPIRSFRSMTCSTKKNPKWIKAFMYAMRLKKW